MPLLGKCSLKVHSFATDFNSENHIDVSGFETLPIIIGIYVTFVSKCLKKLNKLILNIQPDPSLSLLGRTALKPLKSRIFFVVLFVFFIFFVS